MTILLLHSCHVICIFILFFATFHLSIISSGGKIRYKKQFLQQLVIRLIYTSEICCVCWWYSWHHGFRLFLHSGKGSQRLLFYYLLGLNNDKLYRHVLLHMSTCISNTHTFSLPSTVTHSQYRSNLSLALHFIFYPCPDA